MSTEEILALFESMEAAEGGRAAVFRYLLALLLLRERDCFGWWISGSASRGGRCCSSCVGAGPQGIEPEVVEVVDPGMDEEAVAAGIEELWARCSRAPNRRAVGRESAHGPGGAGGRALRGASGRLCRGRGAGGEIPEARGGARVCGDGGSVGREGCAAGPGVVPR